MNETAIVDDFCWSEQAQRAEVDSVYYNSVQINESKV